MIKTIKKNLWDAALDTCVCDAYNNAELTISLKIGFKQINPAGGAAFGTYNDYGAQGTTARKIIKWNQAEWAAWKKDFVTSAQKFWHGKFWLMNNFSSPTCEHGNQQYIPNIWCKFELIGVDAAASSNHHQTIEVVRLDKSETWFGSHSRLYDNLDTNLVRKGTDSKGNPIMQRAHVHEIGHLLGLGHVDVGKSHCPSTGNTNLAPCYGVKDSDKYSVMGQGMQLRDKHATPWRQAIIELTGKGTLANPSHWTPKQQRHYPRTLDEVAANKQITTRPNR